MSSRPLASPASSEAADRSGGSTRWGLALVGLAAVLWALGFFAGVMETPWQRLIDDDENAAVLQAELLAGGFPIDDADFQLLASCGGCRVLVLSAWGLFSLFPPALITWKILPLLFGLLAVLACAAAGWRFGGPVGGALAALLVAMPPPVYRDLGLRAWGNHFEVSGLVAAVIALGAPVRSGRQAFLLGVVAALAVTFAYTAGPIVFVLLAFAWLAGTARGHLLGGVLAGSVPWLVLRLSGAEAWFDIYGREVGRGWAPGAWLGSLGEPLRHGMWATGDLSGWPAALGWTAFFAVPIALVGLPVWRRRSAESLGLVLGLGVLVHLTAFVLMSSSFPDYPPTALSEPGSWRYLAPLFPVVAIGASLVATRGGSVGVLPTGVLLLLGAVALWNDVSTSQFDARPLHVPAPHLSDGAHAGRVGGDPAAPMTDLRIERPLARRQILYEAGLAAGRKLLRSEPLHTSWWPWVKALPEVERIAVLIGVATVLRAELGGGEADPREPEPPVAAAIRQHLPPSLQDECERALVWRSWGFARTGSQRPPQQRGSWLAGYRAALGEGPAASAVDAEWARGFGEGVGALRGYRSDARGALDAVPEPHRAVAEAGFERARAWLFPR